MIYFGTEDVINGMDDTGGDFGNNVLSWRWWISASLNISRKESED